MSNRTPSIVPMDDQSIYLVLDDFGGRLGLAWPETRVEATDSEKVIQDLLDGQYSNPVRIVGFNTAEGWALDVSEDVAEEIRERCDRQGHDVPAHLEGFMDRHENRARRQFRLRLTRRG